jgi:hypothetical protein
MTLTKDEAPRAFWESGEEPPSGAARATDREFPVTIRTRPLRLVDVEACRDAFMRRFAAHPERIDTLAAILQARDEETRRRFRTRSGLVAYLRALLLG